MFLRLFLGLFILVGIFVPVVAQNSADLNIIIISEPVVDDSTRAVSVQFIVEDESIPVVDLSTDALSLSESAENIQLNTSFDRTLNLAIAVDLSFGSDADLVRDSLRAFFDNYYLSSDNITLYIVDASVADSANPRIVPIDSLETANNTINSLNSAETFFSVEPMLQQILSDLQAIPDTPLTSRQVLFVGSFLNRPSDAQNTRLFAENNIAVHGVQAHRTRDEFTTTYRGLTNTGGGLFANNFEGIFVIPGDRYQPINNLKVLYDTIGNSRVVYTLTWQTQSLSLESQRAVDISLVLPSGTVVEQSIDYTFNFLAPELTFVNQRSFDVERQISRLDDLSLDFGLDERAVPVEIGFPDGVPRNINSLRLQVLDSNTAEVLQSDLVLEPVLSDNRYTLTWDLSDYTSPDTMTDVELVVMAMDELGLSAETRTTGSVLLPSAPPIPTATPTATPLPSPTPEPTAIPFVANQSSDGLGILGGNGGRLTGLLLAIIAVLAVAIILLIVRSRRFRKETERVTSVPTTASLTDTAPPVAPINQPDIEEEEYRQFAQLIPTNDTNKRLGIERIWLDSRQFTIGRSSKCDYVVDAPILNDQHCIITIKGFDEVFVRDLSTINGTFVNGERLRGSDEHFVPFGSEVALTKQLTFELWEADRSLNEAEQLSTMLKSTMYTNAEHIPFKPLPGLRYAPDTGPELEDDYSPI